MYRSVLLSVDWSVSEPAMWDQPVSSGHVWRVFWGTGTSLCLGTSVGRHLWRTSSFQKNQECVLEVSGRSSEMQGSLLRHSNGRILSASIETADPTEACRGWPKAGLGGNVAMLPLRAGHSLPTSLKARVFREAGKGLAFLTIGEDASNIFPKGSVSCTLFQFQGRQPASPERERSAQGPILREDASVIFPEGKALAAMSQPSS